ncbi:MAG: ABC transporter permease [Candidatus Sulfopaludibacter sp.]|nr:ABC transporter permease [Candidatus Sulfopaludibacter sp.]
MRIWKKLRTLWRQNRFEADLAEEIRIHREMSGQAAFGGTALFLEQSREVWGIAWLESWKQDIRYALRSFRRSPGFALGVIGAIGLGIGLNTTMFTVFNAYALRPFAVHDPYGLYELSWYGKTGNGHWFTWDQFRDLRTYKAAFSDVMATGNFGAQVNGRTLLGQTVSGNYFSMLGVGIAQGRPLLEEDNGAVAVVSYQAWRNTFGADPALVGRKIYIRGTPFEVVGIASPAFSGMEGLPTGFWLPLRMSSLVTDREDLFGPRHPESLHIVGRLQPGVSPEAAKSALLAWARAFAPDAIGVTLVSRATSVPLNRDAILTFLPIFAAFALVLMIACANVSNMMLARALARQREIAIRISLGAGRARLVRQLLTESVLLALPAAAAGFLISEITIEGARRLLFATVPDAFRRVLALEDLSPDWRVFAFILAASVVTAVLFGLVPAIQTTRSRLVEANRGDFSSDYRPARLRNFLVVAQVAVCALLLICTAIVLRSQARVTAQTTGLDIHAVWDVRAISRYQAQVATRLAAEPGVEAIAAAWRAPLYGSSRGIAVIPNNRSDSVVVSYNLVSSGYFSVFRIPVLRGRAFSDAESEAEAPVVIVSESAARLLWPNEDAIGQSLGVPAPATTPDRIFARFPRFASARVVGLVGDTLSGLLEHSDFKSCIYFPTHAGIPGNDSILVRMSGPQGATRRRIETAMDQIAPGLADFINPMDDVLALQIYPFRVTGWVAGFLAGVALLMTVSGIYGVMSYLVSQRRKEIGIRVALGASAWQVVRMVVRQSAWLATIGAALGAGLALAISPVFAHQLEAIQPYDWAPYVATALVVLIAAIAASYAPARRAVTIDPVRTLRCD